MENQSTIKAGLFVIAGLLLALVGYVLLIDSIGQGDRYVIRLDNLGGLEVGAGVQFEGYPIGTVDTIEPVFESSDLSFEIGLMVESGWPIYEDSLATIESENLLAPKAVQISRGQTQTLKAVGAELKVTEPVDALSGVLKTAAQFETLVQDEFVPVLRTVNELLDGEVRDSIKGATQLLEPLAAETPELLARLISTVERLEAVIDNDTMGAVQQSVDDLASVLSETKQLVAEVRPKVMSVLDSADQLTDTDIVQKAEQSMDEVHQAAQKANALATRFDTDIAQKAEQSMNEMHEAARAANALATRFDSLSDRSDDRILAIIDRLERAAMNLEDMTATLRQEPSRLIRGTE